MYKEKILLFLLILAINIAYIYHASRNEKYLTEITPLKVLGTVITNWNINVYEIIKSEYSNN